MCSAPPPRLVYKLFAGGKAINVIIYFPIFNKICCFVFFFTWEIHIREPCGEYAH